MTDREREARDLSVRACRQQGCMCDVEFEVETVDPTLAPFRVAAHVARTPRCPLLRIEHRRDVSSRVGLPTPLGSPDLLLGQRRAGEELGCRPRPEEAGHLTALQSDERTVSMATYVITHEVDDVDHWLSSPKREEVFGPIGVSVRTFSGPRGIQQDRAHRRDPGHGGVPGAHEERRRGGCHEARRRQPGDAPRSERGQVAASRFGRKAALVREILRGSPTTLA